MNVVDFVEYKLEELLKKEKFIQWLQEKQGNEIIGHGNDIDKCPIRAYLLENDLNFYVGTRDVFDDKNTLRYLSPEWVYDFLYDLLDFEEIRVIDCLGLLYKE